MLSPEPDPLSSTRTQLRTFIVLEGELAVYGRVNGKKVSQRLGPGGIHHVGSNAAHGF
jgi:hypothetical protein